MSNICEKWEYKETVYRLIFDFKKDCDSFMGGNPVYYCHCVWYPHKSTRANKMCLKETYSRSHVSKNLSDIFPNKMVRKEEMHYHHCFKDLPYNIPLGGFR